MNALHDALVIERLSARFNSATPLDSRRCETWLDALREADGDSLIADLVEPQAWLLIRYLPIALHWRADSGVADVLVQWQLALREALARAIDNPKDNAVVYYRRQHSALADLLYRSSQGDVSRQWAWQRMALLPRAGLTPAESLRHGLRYLLERSELIWPVLHTLAAGEEDTASLTALLCAVPVGDWHRLLSASPQTAGYLEIEARLEEAPSIPAGRGAAAGRQDTPSHSLPADSRALLRWLAQRPHLATTSRSTLVTMAAAMDASANRLSSAARRRLVETVRRYLDLQFAASQPTLHTGKASRRVPRPPSARADDLPPLPALPDGQSRLKTAWAGSLFWLGRIGGGELLDWQASRETVSLNTLLRALGDGLGVPEDDPALRALCGGELAPPLPDAPTFDPARQMVDKQLATWSSWLDEMAPELPVPRLESVCHRAGELRFEAGWIELHLSLHSADTSIRRLGLDLDPGWLPWLGCVVRIIYDEQG